MAQTSWRTGMIGMLATIALAACSPDEEADSERGEPPDAPTQQIPAPGAALADRSSAAIPDEQVITPTPPPPAPEQPQDRAQARPETSTSTASAVLSWEPPRRYTDGTALPVEHLAGFLVYHGPSEDLLVQVAEVDRHALSITIEDLGAGTHHFAVTAVTISGTESAFSAVGSKRIL